MKFPQFSPAEVTVKENLLDFLKSEIALAGGAISFARYMEIALYADQLGFYTRDSAKWGACGDYITAPHLSSLFAECIANPFSTVLQDIPEGDILELGAGSGIFAIEVMKALHEKNMLPRYYYIYEKSPLLRERQKQSIEKECGALIDRFQWLETLEGFTMEGIIFGNEILDAIPCHIFRIEEGSAKEKLVTIENHQLQWVLSDPISAGFLDKMDALLAEYSFSDGYESEIHLHIIPLMKSIEKTLKKGVVIFFDYGYGRKEYYHPDRMMGTLMCFLQHHRHSDPLLYPGLQDITAHVDFTTVIESTDFDLLGFTTQAGFLLGSELTDIIAKKNISIRENAAIKRLILPQEMGEIIKVIGLGKGFDRDLSGFSFQDLRGSL